VQELGPFVANMYLAEDRILCFEILAKRHRQWLLRYVTGAVADTDAPTTLIELIKQRRRQDLLRRITFYIAHIPISVVQMAKWLFLLIAVLPVSLQALPQD
jgi:cellulose synthase/poly-beta-1,6-N-acetylglucosamine synthase-like glycosyltransferase